MGFMMHVNINLFRVNQILSSYLKNGFILSAIKLKKNNNNLFMLSYHVMQLIKYDFDVINLLPRLSVRKYADVNHIFNDFNDDVVQTFISNQFNPHIPYDIHIHESEKDKFTVSKLFYNMDDNIPMTT